MIQQFNKVGCGLKISIAYCGQRMWPRLIGNELVLGVAKSPSLAGTMSVLKVYRFIEDKFEVLIGGTIMVREVSFVEYECGEKTFWRYFGDAVPILDSNREPIMPTRRHVKIEIDLEDSKDGKTYLYDQALAQDLCEKEALKKYQ